MGAGEEMCHMGLLFIYLGLWAAAYKDVGCGLEHQSDTKVFTMMMEILSEPTSNKLCDALVMRTASAAAKPCQGDSSEFYLITGISLEFLPWLAFKDLDSQVGRGGQLRGTDIAKITRKRLKPDKHEHGDG
ncbi:hypothetical protein Tco_1532029 [Tanacetum coccineum]